MTAPKRDEPLPCPWCGKEPTVGKFFFTGYNRIEHYVDCPRKGHEACVYGRTRAAAIRAWNRRKA